MRILGIDPGIDGGLGVVDFSDPNRPVASCATDTKTSGEGASRRINAPATQDWILAAHPTHAIIENAQAFPKGGVSGMFRYGRAAGALEGIVGCCRIPMLPFIQPVVWKRALGLSRNKEESRQRAILLFPDDAALFERAKDHQRAEALLIAYYGGMKLLGRLDEAKPARTEAA